MAQWVKASKTEGMRCLVTGVTGYIGGRLVSELLDQGHEVRVLARHPERLADRTWIDDVEVVAGDAQDVGVMNEALADIDVAYYLMHSMLSGADFHNVELNMARTFSRAANAQGVGRIVYLGALQPDIPERELSEHFRSRGQVGDILRQGDANVIEFRAAMVIGSGSASFEMVRYLTERLPVMVTPAWVRTRTQPIAVRDILYYLSRAPQIPAGVSRVFELGGPDVMTYQGMIDGYADVSGFKRPRIIPVSVISPKLSSMWVGLVTPVPPSMARPLVESLAMEAVCHEHDIAEYIPDPPEGLISYRRSLELALARVRNSDVQTAWSSSSLPGAPSDPLPSDPDWTGGSLKLDERETVVNATPEALWNVIEGLGGEHGYYSPPVLWEVRGFLDQLVGGVGLARGRRDSDKLRVGDPLDFWRVEERIPNELLRLRAEMRLPGLAWLELSIRQDESATGHPQTVYVQKALFKPRGIPGEAYWRAVTPFHELIFGSMLKNIRQRAEAHPVDPVDQVGTQSQSVAPPTAS